VITMQGWSSVERIAKIVELRKSAKESMYWANRVWHISDKTTALRYCAEASRLEREARALEVA